MKAPRLAGLLRWVADRLDPPSSPLPMVGPWVSNSTATTTAPGAVTYWRTS